MGGTILKLSVLGLTTSGVLLIIFTVLVFGEQIGTLGVLVSSGLDPPGYIVALVFGPIGVLCLLATAILHVVAGVLMHMARTSEGTFRIPYILELVSLITCGVTALCLVVAAIAADAESRVVAAYQFMNPGAVACSWSILVSILTIAVIRLKTNFAPASGGGGGGES